MTFCSSVHAMIASSDACDILDLPDVHAFVSEFTQQSRSVCSSGSCFPGGVLKIGRCKRQRLPNGYGSRGGMGLSVRTTEQPVNS